MPQRLGRLWLVIMLGDWFPSGERVLSVPSEHISLPDHNTCDASVAAPLPPSVFTLPVTVYRYEVPVPTAWHVNCYER